MVKNNKTEFSLHILQLTFLHFNTAGISHGFTNKRIRPAQVGKATISQRQKSGTGNATYIKNRTAQRNRLGKEPQPVWKKWALSKMAKQTPQNISPSKFVSGHV